MAEGRTWLRYGCFGCIGLLGVVLLVVVALGGLAFLKARSETVEDRTLTLERTPDPAVLPPGTPLVVRLDLRHAGFEIRPAAPGEPLHVDAHYDSSSYDFEQRQETEPDGRLVYGVVFRRRGSTFLIGLKEMLGGTRPEVDVFLPRETLLDLDFRLAQGGAEIELGGLLLRNADLACEQGGWRIAISEPLAAPMERMSIRGSMGGFDISELGNASPRELSIDLGMGGFDLDLSGRWVRDATIDLRARYGGITLRLPDDVAVEGIDRDRVAPPPVEAPTLRFRLDTETAGLEIK